MENVNPQYLAGTEDQIQREPRKEKEKEKRTVWFLDDIYIPTSKLGFLYKRKKPRASLIFSEFFF